MIANVKGLDRRLAKMRNRRKTPICFALAEICRRVSLPFVGLEELTNCSEAMSSSYTVPAGTKQQPSGTTSPAPSRRALHHIEIGEENYIS